jgi:hypothetical protein|tara:strand:+ start:2522 stop:3148 length:627 start_codon:yes stop_codon:yes gene_type:complete
MRKHHNKLYYGKFKHKTVFKVPGSLMFYPTTNEHLLQVKKNYANSPDMNFLADFIINNRNNIKFRFQGRKVIFYSKKNLAQQLIERFWDFWIGSESVDPRFKNLNSNTVGCSRLPHGKYRFQVHVKRDAQLYITNTQRDNLRNFLERNVDDCLVTGNALLDYLEDKSQHCFGGYFYVTHDRYITPIYMMAQEAIDKVIQFRKVENGSN